MRKSPRPLNKRPSPPRFAGPGAFAQIDISSKLPVPLAATRVQINSILSIIKRTAGRHVRKISVPTTLRMVQLPAI